MYTYSIYFEFIRSLCLCGQLRVKWSKHSHDEMEKNEKQTEHQVATNEGTLHFKEPIRCIVKLGRFSSLIFDFSFPFWSYILLSIIYSIYLYFHFLFSRWCYLPLLIQFTHSTCLCFCSKESFGWMILISV